MIKFSSKLKKTCFWSIWGGGGGAKKFSWQIWLSRTTSHGIPALCQISEKTKETIQRKHLHRSTDGRMDRAYFIGPFQLSLGVQNVNVE